MSQQAGEDQLDAPKPISEAGQNNAAECMEQPCGHRVGATLKWLQHALLWVVLIALLVLATVVGEWIWRTVSEGGFSLARLQWVRAVIVTFDGLQFSLTVWLGVVACLSTGRWRFAYAAIGAAGILLSVFLASRSGFATWRWSLHLQGMLIPAVTICFCLRNAGYRLTPEWASETSVSMPRPRLRFSIADLLVVTTGVAAFICVANTVQGFYGPWYYELIVSAMALIVFITGFVARIPWKAGSVIVCATSALAITAYLLSVPEAPWIGASEVIATAVWACLIVVILWTAGYRLVRVACLREHFRPGP